MGQLVGKFMGLVGIFPTSLYVKRSPGVKSFPAKFQIVCLNETYSQSRSEGSRGAGKLSQGLRTPNASKSGGLIMNTSSNFFKLIFKPYKFSARFARRELHLSLFSLELRILSAALPIL